MAGSPFERRQQTLVRLTPESQELGFGASVLRRRIPDEKRIAGRPYGVAGCSFAESSTGIGLPQRSCATTRTFDLVQVR
jgi:hypothetical protein